MQNVLKPLVKSVLISLGLTAAALSAIDPSIQKKIFGSDRVPLNLAPRMTTLIISNG